MTVRTLTLDGREYVLIPRRKWEAMARRSKQSSAAFHKALPLVNGMYTLQHVRQSLGNKVTAQRKAARLTQAQLANLAKVRIETISRLENGLHTPSAKTFDKIERALKKASNRRAA
jgi:DNA-binding XRE family transcriptional regulator